MPRRSRRRRCRKILNVPAGHEPFMEAHATGTQNYECRGSNGYYAWTFRGPARRWRPATARSSTWLSANPVEGGTSTRDLAQHTVDGSTVWAKAIQPSDDPAFVQPGCDPVAAASRSWGTRAASMAPATE